ncbi:MAG: hypothetical protein KKF68_00845 [Nanoarchaeota archaeon]|nr:hypothetical protein [Nanoarchaeota archaeon]
MDDQKRRDLINNLEGDIRRVEMKIVFLETEGREELAKFYRMVLEGYEYVLESVKQEERFKYH